MYLKNTVDNLTLDGKEPFICLHTTGHKNIRHVPLLLAAEAYIKHKSCFNVQLPVPPCLPVQVPFICGAAVTPPAPLLATPLLPLPPLPGSHSWPWAATSEAWPASPGGWTAAAWPAPRWTKPCGCTRQCLCGQRQGAWQKGGRQRGRRWQSGWCGGRWPGHRWVAAGRASKSMCPWLWRDGAYCCWVCRVL